MNARMVLFLLAAGTAISQERPASPMPFDYRAAVANIENLGKCNGHVDLRFT